MKTNAWLLSALSAVAVTLLTSCAGAPISTQWNSEPKIAKVDNAQFSIVLVPACGLNEGCNGFALGIVNKTNKNIEVNWNKTLYVSGGQTTGGFMFEGVTFINRNNSKPPDVVFGNSTFKKMIYPNNLVAFTSGKYGGWRNNVMPSGDNGAYVSLLIDGKEISERLRRCPKFCV